MKVGEPFNPFGMFIGSFIPDSLMQYKGISPTAKLCWSRLGRYAGRDGKCYPSQDTLAEKLGITNMQVNRVLNQLENDGFIRRIPPKGKEKLQHKTTRYELLWHKCLEMDVIPDTNVNVSSGTNEKVSSDTNEKVSQRESVVRESVKNINTKVFIAKYCEAYKKIYGQYPHTNGKTAGIASRLVKLPDIMQLMDIYFKSNDKFIVQNAHSLSILESKINMLRNEKSGHTGAYSGLQRWLDKQEADDAEVRP